MNRIAALALAVLLAVLAMSAPAAAIGTTFTPEPVTSCQQLDRATGKLVPCGVVLHRSIR